MGLDSQNCRHQDADIVLKVGAIHPMTAPREIDARTYRAMGVSGQEIVAVTPEPDGLDGLIGEDTLVIDDPGLTVMPTFDDTHTHLLSAGRAAHDVQVADTKDIPEFLDRIRRRAATTPNGQWIHVASNWHELQLAEGRLPTRQELDAVAPDNPVLIKKGGHNDVVNSIALRMANITRDTAAPDGGVIERGKDGELTGRLEDTAMALVEYLVPQPELDEQSRDCGPRQSPTPRRGSGP
jgi:predicted amidohydrolase YtcJ